MKNILKAVAILVMILSMLALSAIYYPTAYAATWSGSGTASSPYLIANESTLRQLATNVNNGNSYSGKYFKVTANITLTQDWTPIGTSSTAFCGTFDGNGKTISGMTVTGDYSGLFAYIGSGATIKNVTLTDYSVTGTSHLAALVAYADAGSGTITISGCNVNGTLQDTWDVYQDGYTAGIVAYANAKEGSITITGCTAGGTIHCDEDSGGIVGYGKGTNRSLKIQNCINNAFIDADDNANYCGGIAGTLSSAELTGCMNYGSVSGNAYSEDNGSSFLGGIAGSGSDTAFIGCGNYGTVSTFFAGGITCSYGDNLAISCLNVGTLDHSSDGYGYALIREGTAVNSYYRYGTGTGITGATSVSSSELASGAVAHALREYFGQTLGTDSQPVPLTSNNRVYKVSVVGEVTQTYYVNYGGTVSLPELSSCAAYFDGAAKFDPTTPITRDYALAAKGYHKYVDGVCSYCGNTSVSYVDLGSCGQSVAWCLTDDGVLTISGTDTMTDFSASNPAPWHSYLSQIQTVQINEGVTSIGSYAFSGLTAMTSVTLPSSMTEIGEYAFNSCTGLTSLTLCKQLKTIGTRAFYQCENLQSITIPDSVTTLGDGAFMGCTGLTSISLGRGLTTIGSYVLSETGLTSPQIPATIKKIDAYAFANCADMTKITFLGGAPTIASTAFSGDTTLCTLPKYDSSWETNIQQNFGGTLTWVLGSGTCGGNVNWVLTPDQTLTISGTGDMRDFSLSYSSCSAPWYSLREQILSVVISDGVTSIGDYAFYYCSSLSSITLPDSVTTIGTVSTYSSYGRVFENCTSLTQITIPKNVTAIASSAFKGCSNLRTIDVASGNTSYTSVDGILYNYAKDTLHCYPAGKTGAFTIPSNVKTIGAYAFYGCEGLTAVDLGSVNVIDKLAFYNCTGLTQLTFPSSVTSIKDSAFGYCSNLKQITFEGNAPTMSNWASYYVTASVDYPVSNPTWTTSLLKNYGGTLTWNTDSGTCGTNAQWTLAYVNTYATLTISGTGAMNNYSLNAQPWANYLSNIKTVVISEGITNIGSYALCNGSSVTSVSIPTSVTSIGDYAFSCCTSLSTLQLGRGVKTIGARAFQSIGATALTIPDSVTAIGNYAFSGCTGLKTVTLGNGVKTIGDYAFKLTGLTTLTIPDNVTSIGGYAFSNCTALQTVDLGGGVTTLNQYAFSGCSSLIKVVVPATVTTVGSYAFRNCTSLQYVQFLGNAPTLNSYAFYGTTTHAYYNSSKSNWTSSKLSNYGGTVTWHAVSQQGTTSYSKDWFLDTSGELAIYGTGYTPTYSATSTAPWYDLRDSITKVSFGSGITGIGAYAFNGCSSITVVSIPSSVTSVGNFAFADCSALQVVMFAGNAPSFGANSFCNTTCEAWYPSTASGWSAYVRNNCGGSLTWKSTTAQGTCGANAVWALSSSGTLVIMGSGAMTDFSSYTSQPWYSNASSITSVVIGGNVTSVGKYAFRYCDAIQTVTIGAGVTTINNYAFASCTALDTITFFGNAPSFGTSTFYGTSATAYYPLSNATWTSSVRKSYGGTLTWATFCPSHVEASIPAVAPTCTSTGLTEGKYCTLCNEVLVAQSVVSAKGHVAINEHGTEVSADSLEPDCTNAIVCTACNTIVKAALGHRVVTNLTTVEDPLTITNTSAVPFILTNGTYYSNNKTDSSSSSLLITARYACTLTLHYGVSSEQNYDKLYILLNGTQKAVISGLVSDQTITLTLAAGDVVTIRYSKDSSTSRNDDQGWVSVDYANSTVEQAADTAQPDCTNAVVCHYCQIVLKEALGHRVILELPAPFEVQNADAVPFVLTDGVYYSNNHGSGSTSTMQIVATNNCTLTLRYGVSCEPIYDKLSILLNGVEKAAISGIVSDQELTLTLNAGDIVSVCYSKDNNINQNDDHGWVSVHYDVEAFQQILPADSLEADCTNGVICDYCQAIVKEVLDHSWVDATCTVAKTCSVCGETEGQALGHEAYTYSYADGVHHLSCTLCGITETMSASDGKKFAFNTAAPTLSDDIVMKIATTLPAGFSELYMVVEFNDVTTTLTSYTINEANGRYVFAFTGINPQTMGDTFHATLYATVDGVPVSISLDYSVLKYINSQLKKEISAQLRTALSDLVMYGQANQIYEGYKTDALLSTQLETTATLTPSTFSTLDDTYNKQLTSGDKDTNIDLKGVALSLGSKLRVKVTIFCAVADAYSVKVTLNGEEYVYPVSGLDLASGYTDRYVLYFDQIRATQFGEEITFSFLDADGNQVGRTLEYSVYTYVQKNQNAANPNLANLLQTIYNYGESVKKI